MNKFRNSLTVMGLVIGLALSTQAQNVSYYYSDFLCATNFQLVNASPNSALGATNLVAANYDIHGPYVSTKGITPNDQNAAGVTIETVWSQPTTNSAAANLVITVAPVMDEWVTMRGGTNAPFPYPYNTFTFTNAIVPTTTGIPSTLPITNAYIVQVPATNFLGCKKFKVVSMNYAGTNTSLTILSCRAGFWY